MMKKPPISLIAILALLVLMYAVGRTSRQRVEPRTGASTADANGRARDATIVARNAIIAKSLTKGSIPPQPFHATTSPSASSTVEHLSPVHAVATQALEDYLRWAKYPPHSRPPAEQASLLHPHLPIPSVRPLEPNHNGRVSIRYEQDRVYLISGDAATVTMSATIAGKRQDILVERAVWTRTEETTPNQPQADQTHMGQIRTVQTTSNQLQADQLQAIAALEFRDDGAAPDRVAHDGVMSAVAIPPQVTVKDFRGDLRLVVTMRVAGESGSVDFPFIYTGDPPARFTGAVRDAVEEGSLALYVGIDVFHPGRFVAVARLYDARDRPIALLHFNDRVGPDGKELRLLAFGKLLRDAKAEPPFVLRYLEAWRMTEDTNKNAPDRELMEMWTGPFTTASYALSAFSEREWESPNKARRVQALQRILEGRQ